MTSRRDEFYIGWAPTPPGQRRFTRIAVLGLFVFAAGLGALLASRQARPSPARFEYGEARAWRGRVSLSPAPILWTAGGEALLLVAPGKHGATDLLRAVDGRTVELSGALIERPGLLGPHRMLEIVPESLHRAAVDDGPAIPAVARLGSVRWHGEIVDGKCYLGVMVPGEGKTHRDCAARCLSGGTPPLFALADGQGGEAAVLLVADDDRPLGPRLAPYAAEPIHLRGELERHGPLFVLRVDATRIDHSD